MTLFKKRVLIKEINITEGGQYESLQVKIPASAYRVTGIGATTKPIPAAFNVNIRYYGVGAPDENSAAFILTLAKEYLDGEENFFQVNPGVNEKIYYAQAVRLGIPVFEVNTFLGGFLDASPTYPRVISVTDAVSGITEDFYLYESTNTSLGQTTVTVNQA